MNDTLRHRLLTLQTAAAALAAVWMVAAAGIAAAAERAPARQPALDPLEGEVIVRFKADATVLRRHALAARAEAGSVRDALSQRASMLGGRVGHTLASGLALGEREQVMRSASMPAAELARVLAADPEVEYAVPNGRRRATVAPNDPLYAATASGVRPRGPDSGQWYLRAPAGSVASSIDIESAWARTTGRASVVVAVLDTGVRLDHPDIAAGRVLPGYDFVSDSTIANDGGGRDSDPNDPGDWVSQADINADNLLPVSQRKLSGCTVKSSSWHGTSTASLIGAAANNAVGMAGAAPGVSVLPVRVLGKCYGIDSDIIAAMKWAAGISVQGVPDNPNPAKVLNMSLGGTGDCTTVYQAAVNEIVAKGVIIVSAAGNGAGGKVGVPANCAGVIAVLGLRHVGSKVGFSDLGNTVSIAAPGGNCVNVGANEPCLYPILAATNTGTQGPSASAYTDSFNVTAGTSFSSPLVAAVAGLMASQQPLISAAQVKSVLQSTARAFPTTGADNGSDPTPVPACRAPQTNVEQLQCYCNTDVCGAGMLDAGRAVINVPQEVIARQKLKTEAPIAGSAVQLSAEDSLVETGRTVVGWAWSVTNSGGIVSGFIGSSSASTASLTPGAAGSFTVRLTVTDDIGRTASVDQSVTVAAAPVTTPPPPATSGGGGGGGGGMAVGWVVLLGLATALLLRDRWRLTAKNR